MRNSKRMLVDFDRCRDPMRATETDSKRGVVYMATPNKNLGTSCTHRQSNHRAMRRDHRTRNDHEHPGSPPLGPRGGRGRGSCSLSAASPAAGTLIGHARPTAAGSWSESLPHTVRRISGCIPRCHLAFCSFSCSRHAREQGSETQTRPRRRRMGRMNLAMCR